MVKIPDDLAEVVNMAVIDLEEPGDMINESAEYLLIMRRQNVEGDDEVATYASDGMTATTVTGMLQLAQHQFITGLTDNF